VSRVPNFRLSLVRGICGTRGSDDFEKNLFDTPSALLLHTRLQLVKDNPEQLNLHQTTGIPHELSRDRLLAVSGATRTSSPPNLHL
jgi:hypothetical protein